MWLKLTKVLVPKRTNLVFSFLIIIFVVLINICHTWTNYHFKIMLKSLVKQAPWEWLSTQLGTYNGDKS